MGIPDNTKTEILEALNERLKRKKISLNCPVCQNNAFSMIDGYTRRITNDDIKNVAISGVSVPSVSFVCPDCGHILDFSLGVLGMIKQEKDGGKDSRTQ